MIVIDMDMPKNCVECHEKGIQELLECRLIFSGCANCGRHPSCPIKCDIEDIKAEIKALKSEAPRYVPNYVAYEWCLEIIDKHIGKEKE